MKTRVSLVTLFIFLAFLLAGCVLTEPGPDGGPSPLSIGVDTAVETFIDEASEDGNVIVALITAIVSGSAATYGAYRLHKKRAARQITNKINLIDPNL